MNHTQSFVLVMSIATGLGMIAWAQNMPLRAPAAIATAGSASPGPANQTSDNSIKWTQVSPRLRRKAERVFLAGTKAMGKNDPRAAEKDFQQAAELDPNNSRYQLSAEIARQAFVAHLVHQAQKQRALGNEEASLAAIEAAMRLDPQNPAVSGFIDTLAADASAQFPEARATSTEAASPIALKPQTVHRTFHLRTAAVDLIGQVLNGYGIHPTLDLSVRNRITHFDADDVDFETAADLLKLATNTFFVPLDSSHVIVAADTRENRNKYDRQVTETLYFPGLTASELNDMGNIARNIFGAEHAIVQPDQSTMTVRMPGSDLPALNETFAALLSGRSELQLDVRLYEVDKTKATNIGVILPGSVTVFNVPSELNNVLQNNASLIQQLLASEPSLAGNYAAILAALIASGALTGTVFNNSFAVFGGGLTLTGIEWNATSINMLLNSSDTRLLDQMQLRMLDQEEATFRSGERYPLMTSSFSSLESSSNSLTIPQIQYEDLGLTLKAKPHIENENAVSLNLDLKVTSLAGSTINNIPVLNSRQYTGTVSMRLGDSVMVTSAISQQDSLEITGIPGLSDIPGFGGTNQQDTRNITELVVLVTPHIVRMTHTEPAGPMLLLPHQ